MSFTVLRFLLFRKRPLTCPISRRFVLFSFVSHFRPESRVQMAKVRRKRTRNSCGPRWGDHQCEVHCAQCSLSFVPFVPCPCPQILKVVLLFLTYVCESCSDRYKLRQEKENPGVCACILRSYCGDTDLKMEIGFSASIANARNEFRDDAIKFPSCRSHFDAVCERSLIPWLETSWSFDQKSGKDKNFPKSCRRRKRWENQVFWYLSSFFH